MSWFRRAASIVGGGATNKKVERSTPAYAHPSLTPPTHTGRLVRESGYNFDWQK
jgi:hypothetical protein